MRLLLDTHIALWAVSAPAKLAPRLADLLLDEDNTSFISTATLWEIAIKVRLRRGRPGDMPLSSSEAYRAFEAAGFEFLPVTPQHTLAMENLPPLHSDPFDRMLIAQARTEPLRLLTADRQVAAYGEGVELF